MHHHFKSVMSSNTSEQPLIHLVVMQSAYSAILDFDNVIVALLCFLVSECNVDVNNRRFGYTAHGFACSESLITATTKCLALIGIIGKESSYFILPEHHRILIWRKGGKLYNALEKAESKREGEFNRPILSFQI